MTLDRVRLVNAYIVYFQTFNLLNLTFKVNLAFPPALRVGLQGERQTSLIRIADLQTQHSVA